MNDIARCVANWLAELSNQTHTAHPEDPSCQTTTVLLQPHINF